MFASFLKNIFNDSKELATQMWERLFFAAHKPLKNLYQIFEKSPEGKWIIGKNDAVKLFKLVKKYDPKNILELGSGIGASTAVLALAMGNGGKITTMEQYEKCINIAKTLIPENLKNKINFIYSPAESWQDRRFSTYQHFSIYKNIPADSESFDMVLVDGPDFWVENSELVNLPNGDIFKLIPRLTPGCKVYIDSRKPAVTLYKRYASNYLTLLKENKDYALFERNQNQLDDFKNFEVKDTLLGRLKGTTYFKQPI